jgi:uncharacterized protein (TIGR03435 family)
VLTSTTPLGLIAAQQTNSSEPAFDVVSIRLNKKPEAPFSVTLRPDGGITITNAPVQVLLQAAWPSGTRGELVGMPDWTRTSSASFDVIATAMSGRSTPTAEQRRTMMRAMLVDRFKLVWHTEMREVPAYDLVLAREDGALGPGLRKSTRDCHGLEKKRLAAIESARAEGKEVPPDLRRPSCLLTTVGNRQEGDFPIENLAELLRSFAGRVIVDKTGLQGTYFLSFMPFEAANPAASVENPSTTPGESSVFTAVQEQFGLKLVPSRTLSPFIVIDRLEPPSEN